jgi:hypothetical protein
MFLPSPGTFRYVTYLAAMKKITFLYLYRDWICHFWTVHVVSCRCTVLKDAMFEHKNETDKR